MAVKFGKRTVRLAAAQMVCVDCDARANLLHAQRFVEEAAEAGADLLVFPEFMTPGMRLTEDLWDSAEPTGGPTERWLCENAAKYGMHIGAGYLEAKDGHFYNVFSIATPQGGIAGRVYKSEPAVWEAYFFTGGDGGHFIDTELGRLGVAICFDGHKHRIAGEIGRDGVDIMLLPHSCFAPGSASGIVSETDIERINTQPGKVAALYNKLFGTPALMVNKSGIWDSPLPTKLIPKQAGCEYIYTARSTIIDSDGTQAALLGIGEGLAVADVTVDESAKRRPAVPKHGRYVYPGSASREFVRFIEWLGRRSYRRSAMRRQKAETYTRGGAVCL